MCMKKDPPGLSALNVQSVDTTGAGDAFSGGLLFREVHQRVRYEGSASVCDRLRGP